MTVQPIDHLVVTVRDNDATCFIYSQVLGAQRINLHEHG